jgi:hypothetical protein
MVECASDSIIFWHAPAEFCWCRSVAPILNNVRLYIMGAGEYLEPGLFILDPWGFIVYNFSIMNKGFRQIFKMLIINNWCSIIYNQHFF